MRASSPGDDRRGEMIAAARRWSRRPLERPRHRGRKRRLRPSHGRAQATPAALASRPAPPATRGRGLSRCGDQPSAHREDGAGATPPALPRAGLRRFARLSAQKLCRWLGVTPSGFYAWRQAESIQASLARASSGTAVPVFTRICRPAQPEARIRLMRKRPRHRGRNATSQAKPRPRTGNAGRPGQSASSAGDTRAWTPGAISHQRTGRMERGRRRPLSREPDSGDAEVGVRRGRLLPLASPCVHKGYAGSCHLTDDRSQFCVF